jgi:FkbM family methyltransferase
VYAFEPDPRNFAYLERNVRLNGLDNVVLEQKAVADRNGTLQLFVTEGVHEDSRIFAPEGRTSQTVDVEAVTLDDYFRGREERLDFVKIDVQGAEGVVLAGMEQLAKTSADLGMVLELSPGLVRESGVDPDELVDRLGTTFRIFTFEDAVAPIEPGALKNAAWHSANLFLTRRDGRRDPTAGGTVAAQDAPPPSRAAPPTRRRRVRARMAAVKQDPARFFEQAKQGDSITVFENNVPVLRIGPPEKSRLRPRRERP